MRRAGVFAVVGILFFHLWLARDADYQDAETAADWFVVLGLSGGLFALALALPTFARLVDAPVVRRISFVPAAAAALGGGNLLEDGLHLAWAFWVFVLSLAGIHLGLIGLATAIAVVERGGRRLLAAVPLGTSAAILLYEAAGGLVMLATWLTAAAIALRSADRARAHTSGV